MLAGKAQAFGAKTDKVQRNICIDPIAHAQVRQIPGRAFIHHLFAVPELTQYTDTIYQLLIRDILKAHQLITDTHTPREA